MNNEEILNKLNDNDEASNSQNVYAFKKYIPLWNKEESEFPIAELERYIKFQYWDKKDFNFENELLIRNHLPQCVLDIFFELKEFRSNSRTELLPSQETFARLYAYPTETQDDKAYVVCKFAIQQYLNNSEIIL